MIMRMKNRRRSEKRRWLRNWNENDWEEWRLGREEITREVLISYTENRLKNKIKIL